MERKFFGTFGYTSRGCPLFGNLWKWCSIPYCRKFKQEVLVEWRELERDKNNNNNNKRDEFRWKNNMDILYNAQDHKQRNFLVSKIKRSLRKQPTFGNTTTVFPPNDLWETSAEIPLRWPVTTQIWVVPLIGWIKFPTRHDQSEALPRSELWRVISVEFLRSFLRRHLAGKPVLASPNVGCFLRLNKTCN